MAKDVKLSYSRRDGCWWLELPDGLISAESRAAALEFLDLYYKVGFKKAVRQYEKEAETREERGL